MAHACSTLLIHCMAFRFIRGLRAWMEGRGFLGDCDVIAVPGVAKVLVDSPSPGDADFLTRAIGIAVNLHRVREVILLNHLDCGAYGGSSAFTALDAEHDRHSLDLRAAALVIRMRFPHVIVRYAIASLKPDGSVAVEELGALEADAAEPNAGE